ncbi:MAG: BamA/TamA family outer membrane protein [Bacteroidota bacterium]
MIVFLAIIWVSFSPGQALAVQSQEARIALTYKDGWSRNTFGSSHLPFSPFVVFTAVLDTPRTRPSLRSLAKEKDLIDILARVFKPSHKRPDNPPPRIGEVYFSVLPTAQISPSVGRALVTATNAGFYLGDPENTNLSSVNFSAFYNFNNQFVLPVRSTLWTDKNRTNFIGDWRFMKYPQDTYGLGAHAPNSNRTKIYHNYFRFYQAVLRRIGKKYLVGLGYNLDLHYNIREEGVPPDSVTAFAQYGYGVKGRSVSSGISFNLLRDSRRNSINPQGGFYTNLVYRINLRPLGSDENWHSVYLDYRKYMKVRPGSRNIIALWTFAWATVAGHPPYLDLPSIGTDFYGQTGRSYIQSRYRGKNMLYMEVEYRFVISHSGLLGGVLFVNNHTFSEPDTHRFERVLPGGGIGLRIKLNRRSRTNISIDYAWGVNGSAGIYLNIGEAF